MTTIRERDAADLTSEGKQRFYHWKPGAIASDDTTTTMSSAAFELIEADPIVEVADRRALLVAGDELAKAADGVAWPWGSVPSPMVRLLAAIAAWKETTG